MNDIDKTLEIRNKSYGDFSVFAKSRAIIMNEIKHMHRLHNNCEMPEDADYCICDIINKICRVAATPNHIDSWHDIAGYALKIEKYFKEK